MRKTLQIIRASVSVYVLQSVGGRTTRSSGVRRCRADRGSWKMAPTSQHGDTEKQTPGDTTMGYAIGLAEVESNNEVFNAEALKVFRLGLKPTAQSEAASSERDSLPLWGESAVMKNLLAMVDRVAPTRANVMLVGESGTGKEVVAQSIHNRSAVSAAPFVAINCGALPENLIEAELFGHERGAFTGATREHKGVFERAAGGTLFLDEVTEMPLELQVKLLRVLETGRFYRVGGSEEIQVECRVISATNRNPDRAVSEGKLRADLLYRLAVFPIELPALRHRGSDVELIAQNYLDQLNAESGTSKRFSGAARDALYMHAWPGNVRELRNVVQRAHIMAENELTFNGILNIVATDAVDDGEAESDVGGNEGADGIVGDYIKVKVGSTVAEAERMLIIATLDRCAGNKRQAAKILGISLKTLYNRLNDYERFNARHMPMMKVLSREVALPMAMH
ncbi:MAG: sigma-54-dependent Fis family transcriptional regulator [Gammaproteobacteria bacterium]|nr:sigma-54-dependent Fis family transcriptional regulator [Gammaproteobacteria bacterium]